MPAWLNEGLATVLEPEASADAEATLVLSRERPALSELHGGFVGLSTRDAEVAYATAARGVRRLIELRGMNAVVALVADLRRGVAFAPAFQQRLAMRYEDFAALAARDIPPFHAAHRARRPQAFFGVMSLAAPCDGTNVTAGPVSALGVPAEALSRRTAGRAM